MSLMKWLRRLAWALLALVIAAVAVRPVRKALEVVALEATGQIQDFTWSEMRQFLHRGSGMNADRMLKTKDPYSSIFAPPATPERYKPGTSSSTISAPLVMVRTPPAAWPQTLLRANSLTGRAIGVCIELSLTEFPGPPCKPAICP